MIRYLFKNEYFLKKMLMYIIMVSYSGSSYTNDFFDLSGVYFNSTSQSSSSIDIDELDTRYLQKQVEV